MDLSPLGGRATAGTLRASEGVVLHHTWTLGDYGGAGIRELELQCCLN